MTGNTTTDTTPDDHDELLDWLQEWIDGETAGVFETGIEVLRDIVERPDAHEQDIDALVEHDDTHRDIADALGNTGPEDWGYPAEDWDDVCRVIELQDGGLSRLQAIVWMWKEKDLTHEEIAENTDIPKGTIDVHSRRVRKKVRDAQNLLAAIDIDEVNND